MSDCFNFNDIELELILVALITRNQLLKLNSALEIDNSYSYYREMIIRHDRLIDRVKNELTERRKNGNLH